MTILDDRHLTDDRIPPSSIAFETNIVGSAMYAPNSLDDAVQAGLRVEDFYHPVTAAVWEAINRLADAGDPYDPQSVTFEMLRAGTHRLLPNGAHLVSITFSANPGSVGYHARKIRDFAAKRRALAAAAQIEQAAWLPDTDGQDVQAIAERAVESIAAPADDSTWSPVGDVMHMVRDRYEQDQAAGGITGIRWGYVDVDKVMTPMQPGDLAVVVAWAGGGKSLIAANLALDTAVDHDRRCLVHTLEMSRLDLGQRYAAKTGNIRMERIVASDLTASEEHHLSWSVERLQGAPLVVDEATDLDLSRLRASIRKHRPELVIVDQIPIMRVDDERVSREQQLTKLTYDLRRLAAKEQVVIVACAQLNSAPMGRAEKLPTLQDIRESRGIGQAATTVVFLHDPTGGQQEHERAGEIDWIIRKQRQGPKDIVIPMAQQFHFARIADLYSD